MHYLLMYLCLGVFICCFTCTYASDDVFHNPLLNANHLTHTEKQRHEFSKTREQREIKTLQRPNHAHTRTKGIQKRYSRRPAGSRLGVGSKKEEKKCVEKCVGDGKKETPIRNEEQEHHSPLFLHKQETAHAYIPETGDSHTSTENRRLQLDNLLLSRGRYYPDLQQPIQEVANEIVYNNWAINWGRKWGLKKAVTAQVGNDYGYVGAGVGTTRRESLVNVGFANTALSYSANERKLAAGVGINVGKYGLRFDRNFAEANSALEVVARGFEMGTSIDRLDRDYGQRIKIRNVEFSFRHDFEDFQDPMVDDNEELTTEIFFGWRSLGVSFGDDIDDSEFGVTFGLRGYEATVLRDFDERQSDFQGNWGNGYQLALNGDFPDPFSNEIYGRLGFGQLGKAYVSGGAGVGNDGIPQASAQLETANFGVGFDTIDDNGDRLLLYSISVGKFSYVWESIILPQNIGVPLALGVNPFDPLGGGPGAM
eukprot:GDKI01044968.1.p1 GENE.GDKI01044968.1~~GDKI01044968.1.p1  ORF type:complete len:481 (+),score=89.23 GDKI01044968.1:91-1533(+)